MRGVTRWRNLMGDFCKKITEDCDECKLKDMDKMGDDELDDWGEVVSDEG